MSNETIGGKLRALREEKGLLLRTAAAMLDMDVAILSKMERGERWLTKEIVKKLSKIYKYDTTELLLLYLSEKIIREIGEEDLALQALHVAEEQLQYKVFSQTDRGLLLKKLRSVLVQFKGIQKAWIFGSFARRDDGPKSDIDIVVKTGKSFSYFDLADVKHKAETEIKRKVDIGFIEAFKPTIREHVKTDLKLIYEKK